MAVVASATGAAVFGLSGVAAGLAGGALLGAGAGALYSGVTGDGNILNSALTGGLIGGAVGGLGAAYGPGLMGSAAPLSAVPTVTGGASPALLAAQSATAATTPAELNAIAAAQGVVPEGAASLPGASLTPPPSTGLTTGQILGYGLAGSAALSLLGNMNTPKLGSAPQGQNPAYIRPYQYSANPTNNYPTNNNGLGSSAENTYFKPTMTAQPIYKAAQGGLTPPADLNFIQGGAYPMSQQTSPTYAVPSQMPTSAQQVRTSYEEETDPLTGDPISMAGGGEVFRPDYETYAGPGGMGKVDPAVFASIANTIGNQLAAKPAGTPSRQPANQPAPNYQYISSNDAVKAYNDAIMQKAIQTYVNPNASLIQQQPMAPQGYTPLQTPSNFDQTLLDQYLSANPNMRSYNAATQRYGAGIPSQSQYDAFKAQKDAEVAQALAQSQMQPYSNDGGGGGAAGGLPRDFAYAMGGNVGNLGSYSDGGRMLKGPGDGMSDNIPASIGGKQPARLADGEFVVPADVVSHLGNGSTDAGAKRLYAMMDNVRKARTGSKKQGKQIKAGKYLPT